jgi:starch-binding outer membrane protein, SusD/RagB family
MRSNKSMFRRALVAGVMLASVAAFSACDTERILDATDPDLINPENLNSPDGAEAVRIGAMRRWVLTTAGPNSNGNESTWLFGGLLVDEWATASTFVQNDEVDTRRASAANGTVTNAFRALHRVRTSVNQALPLMRLYRPTESTKLAELYLARAFAEMQLASDFCNGIPLSDAAAGDGTITYAAPISVDSVFKVAVISADSGIALATATDTQTVAILRALRVIKARALLGIGPTAGAGTNYSAAAALVTPANVPDNFAYRHTFSTTVGTNGIWGQPRSNRRYLVGDSLEGNARNILVANNIPFFSSGDDRIRGLYTISVSGGKTDTTKSQDGLTNSRITNIYDQTTPVDVANGIDARLIEAEAQLASGNAAGMLATLNALRATARTLGTFTTNPANLPPLALPATTAAQQDLLFREAAFWQFSRGVRLGNIRRLVRQYGRAATSVYPEGTHYRNTTYGTDKTLLVPQQEQNNPNWTGCTNTNP